MNLRKVFVPAVAVAALVLGGCSQKTDYAAFHQKATEAPAHSFKTATVKVTTKSDNGSSEATYGLTYASGLWQADDGLISGGTVYAALVNANTAASVGEDDSYVYYFVGNGFKVEAGSTTYTYESHGLLTSQVADGSNVSVSYK